MLTRFELLTSFELPTTSLLPTNPAAISTNFLCKSTIFFLIPTKNFRLPTTFLLPTNSAAISTNFSVQINNLFPYTYKEFRTTYNFSVTYNSSSITYKFAILIYKLPSHTYKNPLLSTMPAVSLVFFIPPKKIVQRITSILTDALDNLIDSIIFLDGMIEYIQVNLHIPKCQLLQHRRQPYMAGRSLTLSLIQLHFYVYDLFNFLNCL